MTFGMKFRSLKKLVIGVHSRFIPTDMERLEFIGEVRRRLATIAHCDTDIVVVENDVKFLEGSN